MSSLPLQHKLLAGVLFAAALGAGWWLSAAPDAESEPAWPKSPRRAHVPAAAPVPQARPGRSAPWPAPSPQALRAWSSSTPEAAAASRVPPQPRLAVVAAPASAPPRAPAPAWRFVGRITDGGTVRAMLLTPQQLRVVAEQELVEPDWRVERIGEQGVELTWLPGAQRVRLAWAAS